MSSTSCVDLPPWAGGHPQWLTSTSCRCGSTISSRFNLAGHVEVNADGGEGHQVVCLGPRFQIEFDVRFEPEQKRTVLWGASW